MPPFFVYMYDRDCLLFVNKNPARVFSDGELTGNLFFLFGNAVLSVFAMGVDL